MITHDIIEKLKNERMERDVKSLAKKFPDLHSLRKFACSRNWHIGTDFYKLYLINDLEKRYMRKEKRNS